jgi:hypothetical protein
MEMMMRPSFPSLASFVLPGALIALLTACSGPAGHGDDDDDGDDTGTQPDARPGDIDGGGDDDVDGGFRPDADPGAPDAAAPDADPGAPDAGPPDAVPPPQTLTVCASGAAYTTVGAAIAAASAGDTIEVCAGTYPEQLVISGKSLILIGLGGSAGTIIDAGSAGTGLAVSGTGGDGVVLDGFTITNGHSTAQGGGVSCTSSTLRIANSAILSSSASGGGGLYAADCTIDVGGTRFEGNAGGPTGGGVYAVNSVGSIHDSFFTSNTGVNGAAISLLEGDVTVDTNELRANAADLRGGGIYSNSNALIANNIVADNTAGWTGGGIQIQAHGPIVRNNTVSGNTSVNDGGGFYVGTGTATLIANTVTGNDSGDDGGGIRIFECACTLDANVVESNTTADGGAGIRISHVPNLLTNNIIRNNIAGGTGGGLDLDNDASTVRGGEITGNRAGGSGGGIFTWLAPWTGTTLENILISGNRAWRGGGIFAKDNFKPLVMRGLTVIDNRASKGAGLMIKTTDFTLFDSVFARNLASDSGGGVYNFAETTPWTDPCPCPPVVPDARISFVVFHENTGAATAIFDEVGNLNVQNSILYASAGTSVGTSSLTPLIWRYNDTQPATFVGMADPTGTEGNIAVDPAFVNGAALDFHLADGSACRDAGDPTMLDGDGTRVDMGMTGGVP